MGLFHPKDLIWALLAVVIAACYFVRFARRRREVSTMMLWQQVFARRTPWRRWQRPVSLLVQLAIFALLVLAYAEPYWLGDWNAARSIVVIVDNSASMNATDVETSRLWQARLDARRLIDDLGAYEQMSILSAGGLVRVQCGFSDDPAKLERALDKIRPTDGDNRAAEAVALARRMLAERKNPQIVLLTDGCFGKADEVASAGDVQAVIHAGGGTNIGITRFEARPSLVAPQAYDVFVEILNVGRDRAACRFDLGPPGAAEITEQLDIPPSEAVRRFYSYEPKQSGPLTAKLDASDHLPADNVASILLPIRRALEIRMADAAEASEGEEWVKRLTAALDGLPLASVRREAGEDGPDGITVFSKRVPPRLPAGPVLAIAPQGNCDLWTVEKTYEGPVVIATDTEAPLLDDVTRGINLRDLVIDSLLQVQFRQPPDAVIRSESGDAVLSAWDRPTGRVLLLHVPLAKSDFTVRESFPLFVANAIGWLRPRDEAYRPSITTADVVIAEASDGQTRRLLSPTGTSAEIAEGQSMIGPLDEAGVWKLGPAADESAQSKTGNASLVVAANVLNARETDLRPAEVFRGGGQLPLRQQGRGYLWITFVLIAVVLLVAEWALRQFKILI